MKIFLCLGLFFLLSSCIEIVEETTIHNDGTGTYHLMLNLSASKVRLNSIMELDSLNGKKVPSRVEIHQKFTNYLTQLKETSGFSDVSGSIDTKSWMMDVKFNFKSLTQLKMGLIGLYEKIAMKKASPSFYAAQISYKNKQYTRSFSNLITAEWQKKISKEKDFEKLKMGSCVFIQRFDDSIIDTSNPSIRISKNGKASMLKISAYKAVEQPQLLDYFIEVE